MRKRVIRISGNHYRTLRAHLFPGDGCEAVALALCGRLETATTQGILVHKLLLVPYDQCQERSPMRVSWQAGIGLNFYKEAMVKHLAILKIHSHPTDYADFSKIDDYSDQELFSSLHGWTDDGLPHASAVMMQGGDMIGRFITSELNFETVDSIAVSDSDIAFYYPAGHKAKVPDSQLRTAQAFGEKTTNMLGQLSIGVVGCSGTGSWIIEQLSRLGVGKLIMVDPDAMEDKNLNRIINSKCADSASSLAKVDVLAKAVSDTGLVREVEPICDSCFTHTAIQALASCDIIFGCMDKYDGRDCLNRLATFYCQPYFDVGVRLDADGHGSVSTVCGSIHYLQPGGSSLLSRGVYTPEDLRVASLKRNNPELYEIEEREGYIKGVKVESPAVVSINGLCATIAVNDFLARIHPFRDAPNSEICWQTFDLVNCSFFSNPDGDICNVLAKHVGRGDMDTPLDCVF